MLFFAQILGVIGAGAVIAALAGPAARQRKRTAAGFALVTATLPIALSIGPAWHAARSDLSSYAHDARLSPQAAAVAGGTRAGVQVDFLRWVKAHLRPGDTFHVPGFRERVGDFNVPPDPQQLAFRIAYDWMLFQLSPNVAVGHTQDADWIVIYQQLQPPVLPASRFAKPERFAPGFALARRRAD